MFNLRDYQTDAENKIRIAMGNGKKSILLHAPTGSGKTAIASDIIKKVHDNGKKALFLANRRELVNQAKTTLESFGLDCGVIMAGVESKLDAQVQIASVQTYVRRMDLMELQFNKWWHEADLVIVDEAHGSISPSFQKILKSYGDESFVLGLTATPCRTDGRGLGEFYDEIVSTINVAALIEQNYLVPVRYFTPSTPDLEGIRTVGGDFDKKELGKRVNKTKLVGDIYDNWSRICPDRPTIIFATNVKHSINIAEDFSRNGVSIAHIDAKTSPEEREETLMVLKSGKLQVITNVGILCEGFDFPKASCIILARPTKSLGLYIQMAGRGLRTAEMKQDCILIDHGGCVERHGLLEWSREWTLDGKKKAWKTVERDSKEKGMAKCIACHCVYTGTDTCPDCGSQPKTFGEKVETKDADLKELNKKQASVADKRIYLGMLKCWVSEKGYSPRMVTAKYKNKFGCWAHHSITDVAPITPDKKFLNQMRHEQIKYAKRKGVSNG